MNKKFAITIVRQYSGGVFLIGKKLSKDLNTAFYGKELIKIELEKELFEASDEKNISGFWENCTNCLQIFSVLKNKATRILF